MRFAEARLRRLVGLLAASARLLRVELPSSPG
jgi:hypothetical protein